MKKKCPKCRGTGSVVVDYKDCDSCGGTGYQDSFDVGNHFKGVNSNAKAKFDLGADQDIPCEVCHGKGQIEVFEECPNCHGSGQINVCNDCGKPISEKYDLPILAEIPLREGQAAAADSGKIETLDIPELENVVHTIESL